MSMTTLAREPPLNQLSPRSGSGCLWKRTAEGRVQCTHCSGSCKSHCRGFTSQWVELTFLRAQLQEELRLQTSGWRELGHQPALAGEHGPRGKINVTSEGSFSMILPLCGCGYDGPLQKCIYYGIVIHPKSVNDGLSILVIKLRPAMLSTNPLELSSHLRSHCVVRRASSQAARLYSHLNLVMSYRP